MRFQYRKYPKLKVVPAGGKGFGVLAGENISEGQFVIEYVGEVIPIEDCAERMVKARHFYFLTIDANEGIDATLRGNIARFINHSCDPNCETQKWWVKGETCIGIFAKKDIPKGTELTFDYQFERLGVAKQKCLCGSVNCRGYLGAAPVKNEMEEVRYVFTNHQRHVEKMLKNLDIYKLDEELRAYNEDPDLVIVKNKIEGGSGPCFLRRNMIKQKARWLNEFHETLLNVRDERIKTLEAKKEKRRQEVQNSRSFLMGLDIATLMRQGLVVFDQGGPAESKLRSKRGGDGNQEEDSAGNDDEDKMDTSK
jgi:RNase H-fold protein (predicted Holliday junction resolvase)